ncbi:Cof-type HAD-IIB family hydrolase [Lactobacillus ultunensis]|uniref:Cof-like hydrolase n=1 Tax=Lactobacillus ultunensis DSM 16047 TaxID=525365 RepID=C2EK54_9LACO|nr:Cof-type HAD-IIB family hydrolase [Lactobacillus ultunensis]EEJ73069.1 Cof-like hydrolase [Lactobacillus ultunensis DSM 16047]KRL82662.1 sugar-phosphatase [Lactobacillus ultunensis DSM 16047]QQP29413.1 HAD family hydrolase [Lactobacillus ultunensis]
MIKLIATDMDGTWLNDQKDYDHALFAREFKEMQERNIEFVVASGNQHANLLTRFPGIEDKIYFVAENGALVAKGKQILHVDSLSDELYHTLLKIAAEYPYPVIVMGLVSAYVLSSNSSAYVQEMRKYVEHLEVVDSFNEVHDNIFKLSLNVPVNKMPQVLTELKQKYPEIGFVSGAADSIDMQTKGMNKAVGLKYLGQKLGIKPSEMIAFGDSGNDVGMLNYVGRSFATSTALKEAKRAADQIIGSCNESAVQKEILKLLNIN